jgi:hypothetical protein
LISCHERCPNPLTVALTVGQDAPADGPPGEDEEPNPFAVLAALKGKARQ